MVDGEGSGGERGGLLHMETGLFEKEIKRETEREREKRRIR